MSSGLTTPRSNSFLMKTWIQPCRVLLVSNVHLYSIVNIVLLVNKITKLSTAESSYLLRGD